MTYFYILIASVLIATLLVPLAARLGLRLGIVDHPGGRKIHTEPIPRTGGAALIIGTLAPFLLMSQDAHLNLGFGAGALVLFVFGLLDDARDIHYAWKFLGQILAAVVVTWLSGVQFHSLGTVGAWLPLAPGLCAFPLTVFILLATTNFINLADGLDGLAAGICILCFSAVGFLSGLGGDVPTVVLCVSVLGAILGFLRYNTHPATVFLGDTGSQFLGFTLGFAMLLLTQRPESHYSPFLPLFLVGVPVIDTTLVFVERILSGESPFLADKKHIHHRLLRVGLRHGQAVVVIYMLQLSLIVLGLTLGGAGDAVLAATYGALLVSLVLFFLLPGKGERLHCLGEECMKRVERINFSARAPWLNWRWLSRIAWVFMVGGLALFWLITPLGLPTVPKDMGIFSLILLVLGLLIQKLSPELAPSAVRICAYFLTIFYVFSWEFQVQELPGFLLDWGIYDALFFAMGGAYFFYLLVTQERLPLVTMDYLLLAVVIFTFFLPEDVLLTYHVHSISARVFIVFLCVELIAFVRAESFSILRVATLAALALNALHAFV